MASWQDQYDIEIKNAKSAQAMGNEGRARVCARRAAGLVIGEYLRCKDYTLPTASAYDRLRLLNSLPDLPDEVYQVTGHLLERVNSNYQLPADADLIKDAEWLRTTLLPA